MFVYILFQFPIIMKWLNLSIYNAFYLFESVLVRDLREGHL